METLDLVSAVLWKTASIAAACAVLVASGFLCAFFIGVWIK